MIENIKGYSYNDLTIVPSVISHISSRSQCHCWESEDFLPIWASPMASVVSCENRWEFERHGIHAIIPRNIPIEKRIQEMNEGNWVALSLKEFEDLFIEHANDRDKSWYGICVDIANGHMSHLYKKCQEAKILMNEKDIYLSIMTGNIANPRTYQYIVSNYNIFNSKTGRYDCVIDYIRVGIGGGFGCITTSNVSAHYPQATLINETYKIKKKLQKEYDEEEYSSRIWGSLPDIVADGGIRNYDHVIKALALGADSVMIGSLFAQCIESAGFKSSKSTSQKLPIRFPVERYKDWKADDKGNFRAYYTDEFIEENSKQWKDNLDDVNEKIANGELDKNSGEYKLAVLEYKDKIKDLKQEKYIGGIDVKFFGMASADGQKSINGKKTKTAEGITKWIPVKYTIKGWVDNMESYLQSIMSYCDCKYLKDFIGKPTLIVNSISEIQAVNK